MNKQGILSMDLQLCRETFILRHALGLDREFGDQRSVIPCEEVAEFCDGGALIKDSSLCREVYRTRHLRLGVRPP